MKDGPRLLDRLIKGADKSLTIIVKPLTRVDIKRGITGRWVTLKTPLREGTLLFYDFWPPETVRSNWDELVRWAKSQP